MLPRIRRAIIDHVETLIGPNSSFNGDLICDGNIRIDGVCEAGLIKTMGNIVIGPEAKVGANLEAENVSVSGTVSGTIKAKGRLEVLSTGVVSGEAHVGSILLDEAASFNGKLDIQSETASSEPVTAQMSSEPN